LFKRRAGKRGKGPRINTNFVGTTKREICTEVIYAAGLADFGFFLDAGAFVRRDDHLAKKSFVNAAKNVKRNNVEIVRGIDVAKSFTNTAKLIVVNLEIFRVKNIVVLEYDPVVNAVEPPGGRNELTPRAAALAKIGNEVFRFDQLIFQKAHENEPVQRALSNFGKCLAV
jgi:hypothetical protein